MHLKLMFCGLVVLCLFQTTAHAQTADSAVDKALSFPSRLLGKLQSRTANLNQQLAQQTTKYLQKMQQREEKMQKKLSGVDSNAAKQLFAGSAQKYAALMQKIKTDTGSKNMPLSGTYMPYLDSLQGAMKFLGAPGQLQVFQGKLTAATQAQAFIQQRKQVISQYISQHANLQGLLDKQYASLNQGVYYYSQQLRQYREMWNNPDQLEQKALALLNKLPSFQTFMKNNSQLSALFHLPGNYASPDALTGLQTKDVVAQQIQGQVAAAGPNGASALQSNMQSAESQLDGYKDKLSKLGQGNGNVDMPDFKPNDQKTKTFWKRIEYGANFQTTHNSYYFPTVTDLGLSIGYKLGHSNIVGVGASYKLGWGNGIQHVALSSQGVGLRSFLEIKIKSSFSATGGFEYNYTTPFTSFQDIRQIQRWTQSGLIGISKTVSMKSRFFKQTKLQLLWDFLSYQQVPKTQPVLFRIGYNF
ncbi:MAG TPA: hypothetical protein VGN00_29785 [Puia sp.]|jgi:hypothetical protein